MIKNHVYTALGFPILLVGVKMRAIDDVEVPDINLNTLQQVVFEMLIKKPARLSGSEVAFMRSYMRLSQTELSKILNQAGHSIVSQWEKKYLQPTGMDYNTEIMLRLHMAKTLKKSDLIACLENLLRASPFEVDQDSGPLKVDAKKVA